MRKVTMGLMALFLCSQGKAHQMAGEEKLSLSPVESIFNPMLIAGSKNVEESFLCPPPTNLAVSEIAETTITISWEPGQSTQWQYAVVPAGSGEPTEFTITNSNLITGVPVEHSTAYKVYVRTYCNIDDTTSSWLVSASFTTLCAAVTTFSENFDDYPAGSSSLPNCWKKLGSGAVIIATGGAEPGSPPHRLQMSGAAALNSIVMMPAVSNLQSETHRLRFRAFSPTPNKFIQVGYYENPADLSTFVLIETVDLLTTNASTAQEYVVYPTNISSSAAALVFRNAPTSGATTVYIDDVFWEPLPSCPDIVEFSLEGVSTVSAQIIWETGGSESAWQYVYGESTVTDPSTLTPVDVIDNSSATLSQLSANTHYKFWVRSNCGDNNLGSWSIPFTFKTDCDEAITFSENFDTTTGILPDCWRVKGNGAAQVLTGGAYPGTPPNRLMMHGNMSAAIPTVSYVILPSVLNLQAETHRLKLLAYATTLEKFLEIGYFEDESEVSSFILLETFNLPGTTASNALNFSFTPQNIPNGIKNLVFRNPGTENAATLLYIDDVAWELIPSCPEINAVSVDNLTANSADLLWTPGGNENIWEYAYGATSVIDPNTLTAFEVTANPSTTITDLAPATNYKVWVRAKCGDEVSEWSFPITFTTECAILEVPTLIQNFEGTTGTSLPLCWSSEVTNGFSNWITYAPLPTDVDINTTISGSRIAFKDYSVSNALLFAPPMDYTAVTESSRVSLYLHRHALAASVDKYTVYVNNVPSLNGAQMILEVHSNVTIEPTAPATGFYNYTADIPVSFNGQSQVYIIIEGYTGNPNASYALGVEDFKVEWGELSNPTFNGSEFKAYPNPVKDILNIYSNKSISTIEVYNLLGQQVSANKVDFTNGQIDMANLSTGTYLVKISSGTSINTVKVIKQ